MSKPQDYEYKRWFQKTDEPEREGVTLSDMALKGWEPIFFSFQYGIGFQMTCTLLRRLRPDVKTEAEG